MFSVLPKFALSAMSIPHANADCERKFSKVNSVKTKTRNRLITDTLNGILLADQTVRRSGCCLKFAPNVQMRNCMTAANIYGPEKKQPVCESDDEMTFG